MGQATDEIEKPVQICVFFALIMYDITVIPLRSLNSIFN